MAVKQFTDVKKSPLYKTIAPSLSPEDRKEFARMLEIARDGYADERQYFDLSQTDVASAFIWGDTPQGHGYWSELAERLDAAGVPGGWISSFAASNAPSPEPTRHDRLHPSTHCARRSRNE